MFKKKTMIGKKGTELPSLAASKDGRPVSN